MLHGDPHKTNLQPNKSFPVATPLACCVLRLLLDFNKKGIPTSKKALHGSMNHDSQGDHRGIVVDVLLDQSQVWTELTK